MAPPLDVEQQLQRHGSALRKLAFELVREAAHVDDAMQETWLRAMRWPPRDTDGVGHWLGTVLRNVVRRSRRRDALRERREAAVVRENFVEDHAVAAVREEATRRLFAAMNTLDLATRDVVWRRFFEGQAPREIAAARGEPVATVKSRLQRGIRDLRERLGKDGGGEWRAAFAAAFGLGKKSAAATALAGGVVMATWMKLSGAAVLIAAIGLAWWWPAPNADSAAVEVAQSNAAPVVASVDTLAVEPPPVQRDPAATVAPPPVVPPPPPIVASAPQAAIVRGRAVDSTNGQPLAGVEISLDGIDGVGKRTATTTSDGAFEFAVGVGKRATLRLRRSDRRTEVRNGATIRDGDTWDVGDVPMAPGRIVRGRVVDEGGAAIPAETFVDCRDPNGGGHTDVDGCFATQAPIALGETTWDIPFGPFELPAPVVVDIGPERPEEVVLKVRARAYVRGVVVDESGQPVAGVTLADQPGIGTITSAADGTFTMHRFRRGPEAVTIHVASAPGCELRAPLTDVPWGTDNVRIELRRLRPFALEVVDDAGVPVDAYAVAIERVGGASLKGNVVQRGAHAAGRLLLDDVARGQTSLRVLPTDRSFEPTEVIAVGAVEPLRIVLERRVTGRVLVCENGAVVAGVRVQLLRERGTPRPFDPLAVMRGMSPRAQLWPVPDPTNAERVWMRGDGTELLDEGVTDDAGLVTLRRGRSNTGHVLRVQASDGRPFQVVRDLAWVDGERPLRVELVRHGSIAGRVELRGRDSRSVRIAVPAAHRTGGVAIDVAGDGAFDVPDLEPGNYELVLQLRGGGGTTLATRRVDVAPGEVARTTLDAGDQSLVTFETVLAGDAPLPKGLGVDLFRSANGVLESVGQADIASDRTFRIADLVPGSYRVGFRTAPSMFAAPPALLAASVQVQSGATPRTPIAFTPRRLVLRVVRPDGSVVRGSRVMVRCGGTTWPLFAAAAPTVDEKLVLDPAPELPIELRELAEGSLWSQPVQMPADRAEADVTVVLPDPPK